MSALPNFTMRELLDAGVHFGHKTMRWDPRMKPFIFGVRNNVHILDLQQTVPMLHRGLQTVRDIITNNGRVLFVGTKRQASKVVAQEAKRCGQYYVNHRWLGGMLTNWNTVSASIKTLQAIEDKLEDKELQFSKKERLKLQRERDKLELSLGGIRDMGGIPNLLFIIDTNKEKIAVEEAKKLGIPIIAIVDSNSNPDNIDFPIPGNDDAIRAISLYCKLIADSVLQGIEASVVQSADDPGALEQGLKENLPSEPANQNTAKEDAVDDKKEEKQKESKKSTADKKETAKTTESKKAEKVSKDKVESEDKTQKAKKAEPKAEKAAQKKSATKKAPAKKKDDTVKKAEDKKADAKKAETKKTADKKAS